MIKNRTDNYNPNYVAKPGDSLIEALEFFGMSQSELAKRMGRPEKTINEIVKGKTSITPETAIQLERVLGVPASFWINLEKNYQEIEARIEASKMINNELEFAKCFPYKEMVKYKWIDDAKTDQDKAERLLYFFGVNTLESVNNIMPTAYRKHSGKSISSESLAAWLRKGEIDSCKIETRPYDEELLKKCLSDFKNYTHKKLNEFIDELQTNLASCGVALTITPPLKNTYVCGATRWITPQKALVQLSLRGIYADIMWFTLYHEIGHILLHGKREEFVDLEDDKNQAEEEANKFASNQLIPDRMFEAFMQTGSLTVSSINKFAERLNVHPGIVVGRLQHENIMGYNQFSDLRIKYNHNL